VASPAEHLNIVRPLLSQTLVTDVVDVQMDADPTRTAPTTPLATVLCQL